MRIPSIRGLVGFGVRDSAPNPATATNTDHLTPYFDTPCKSGATQHEGAKENENILPLPQRVAGGWRGFDESHVAKLHALYYNPDIRVSAIAKVFRVSTSTLLRWIDEMDWPSRRQARKDSMAVLREKGAALHAAWERPDVLPVKDAARIGGELDGMVDAQSHRPEPDISNGAGVAETYVASPSRHGPDEPLPQNAESNTEPDAANPEDLAGAIETQVRQEIALMQQRIHDTSPGSGERNARTLASLVRTLRALKDMQAKAGPAPGPHDDEYDTDLPPRDLAQLREELAARIAKLNRQAKQQAPQTPS